MPGAARRTPASRACHRESRENRVMGDCSFRNPGTPAFRRSMVPRTGLGGPPPPALGRLPPLRGELSPAAGATVPHAWAGPPHLWAGSPPCWGGLAPCNAPTMAPPHGRIAPAHGRIRAPGAVRPPLWAEPPRSGRIVWPKRGAESRPSEPKTRPGEPQAWAKAGTPRDRAANSSVEAPQPRGIGARLNRAASPRSCSPPPGSCRHSWALRRGNGRRRSRSGGGASRASPRRPRTAS